MPLELAGGLVADEDERLLQAEAEVRDYCGWHIAPSREQTVTFAWPTGRRLMLPSLYVTEVSSLTVDGVAQVEDVDFRVHQYGYIDRLGYDARWSGEVVSVTFTHGYTTPPASVTKAVQALAQGAISTNGVVTRKTVGPFTDVYALPADTLAGLGAYRIVPVS